MNRVAVIDVVGLTKGLIGEHTPAIKAFADSAAVELLSPGISGGYLYSAIIFPNWKISQQPWHCW